MRLTFKINSEQNSYGAFTPMVNSEWQLSKSVVDKLSDLFHHNELDYQSCLKSCLDILSKEPLDLNALSLLMDLRLRGVGTTLSHSEDFLSYFLPFFEIMGNFRGSLDPKDDNSITFLSCHYVLILTLIQSERWTEALEQCLSHIKWDAKGAMEIKVFLGNLYILLNNYEEAEKLLTTYPVPMPYESSYSLALVEFLLKKFKNSLTTLRKAFITQPYVAETILSNISSPIASWILPNNDATFFNALSYVNIYLGGKVWQVHNKAMNFLSWSYNYPKMLEERAKALTLLQKILYLKSNDASFKKKLVDDFYLFADTPNPGLISSVLRPVEYHGKSFLPWEIFSHDKFVKLSHNFDEEDIIGETKAKTKNEEKLSASKVHPKRVLAEKEDNVSITPKRRGKTPFKEPFQDLSEETLKPKPSNPNSPDSKSILLNSILLDPMSALTFKPKDNNTPPPDDDGEEEANSTQNEHDCGDCDECEIFDECSESPIEEDVECTECSECEIEGFCTIPNLPKTKTPPYCH
jgi:tetratricopeptide (TPR) repeat protein